MNSTSSSLRPCCVAKTTASLPSQTIGQENTLPKKTRPPGFCKKADVFSIDDSVHSSLFRKCFTRGDLPISIDFNGAVRALKLLSPADKIDLKLYLPIFIEGLTETEEPYKFLAEQATVKVIESCPGKIQPIIPSLILPLKKVLDSPVPSVIIKGLKIIQVMIKSDPSIAEEMVPYFRNLLPAFNRCINKNLNIGDLIEYSEQKRINLSDLVKETLVLLETHGGPQAFVNIKHMIPIYQSCLI